MVYRKQDKFPIKLFKSAALDAELLQDIIRNEAIVLENSAIFDDLWYDSGDVTSVVYAIQHAGQVVSTHLVEWREHFPHIYPLGGICRKWDAWENTLREQTFFDVPGTAQRHTLCNNNSYYLAYNTPMYWLAVYAKYETNLKPKSQNKIIANFSPQEYAGLNLLLLQWQLSRTTYEYTNMPPEDKWLLVCLLNNITLKAGTNHKTVTSHYIG